MHTVDDETHSFFRIVVLKEFSIKDFRCCLEDARELFDKMPEKGCLSNEFSFGILVRGYCRFGLANKGLELLDEMRSSGILPNRVVYNTLISSFYKEANMQAAASNVLPTLSLVASHWTGMLNQRADQ
ncbi:hypothetical protein ERO13_D07G128300v2 [Gossypium hirsutum]|uniref:Pentatricopeptide repeat-containing protein At2g17140 isoform X5 n=4 Tax=Gossypium TaxID=3633 RepID=A0A1U8P257_GOSHI|nr:pentatricopeptide repeat-containing protein At2g17140-like isoform X5 [Gossypium hirsutum]KAB2021420.1 hypothetical protein ES319_D07G137800v1 [Gossypium barbadense]KAG4138334.1 hypothetical protein ERO13_D07G128300v2 [Gossypium hirsutum]TYG61415.1 hypothetical protein ES288_D07G146500v1 [Gossypium darwinii]TYH62796.1 hypothetical protein ES332_D07G144700v1 [Gossypium tomentosum]